MKNRENYAELNEQELQDKYKHFKEELFNLRFQVVTGQLANPARIRLVRRNIARVQTHLNKLVKDRVQKNLKTEYEALVKEKNIDPKLVPLKERLALLRHKLSEQAQAVKREIRREMDAKMEQLMKSLRESVSKRLRESKGKDEEAALRATSQRLRDPKFSVRQKFLDKLSSMGLNEASQLKVLKENKRARLAKLEEIRLLQIELTAGRLPF